MRSLVFWWAVLLIMVVSVAVAENIGSPILGLILGVPLALFIGGVVMVIWND